MVNSVRFYREKAGLTRAALADAAGVSESHIVKLERGDNAASAKLMERIAEAVNVEVSELYKAEPTPEQLTINEADSRQAFGLAVHFIGKGFAEYDKCNDSDKRTLRAFIKTMLDESK